MNKLKVGVVFGSRSTEHDVSIVTAIASIIKPLQLSGEYEPVPIYIDKSGRWYSDPKLKDISLYSSGQISDFLARQKPIQLSLGGGLKIIKPGLKPKAIKLDVVFPATHGTHGEDGELMGLFELADVPYVGCDMPSSVLAMDKALAKIVTSSQNIPTPEFVWFYAADFAADTQAVVKRVAKLHYPLFVKPVHLGSSIGITKVSQKKDLINAIEVAAHYDNKVIVEEAVANLIEVTVPIIGNDKPAAAYVEQPLLNGDDVFDFDTKYMRGGKGKGSKQTGAQGYSTIPANIDRDLYHRSEQLALDVYAELGCTGIARIDLLIDAKTKSVYFNEVNPLPGSLYAHNWRKAGKSGVQLVSELVELALARHEQNRHKTTVFDTNYLKQY